MVEETDQLCGVVSGGNLHDAHLLEVLFSEDASFRGGKPFDFRQVDKQVLELVKGQDARLFGGFAVLSHPENGKHMSIFDGLDLQLECISESSYFV